MPKKKTDDRSLSLGKETVPSSGKSASKAASSERPSAQSRRSLEDQERRKQNEDVPYASKESAGSPSNALTSSSLKLHTEISSPQWQSSASTQSPVNDGLAASMTRAGDQDDTAREEVRGQELLDHPPLVQVSRSAIVTVPKRAEEASASLSPPSSSSAQESAPPRASSPLSSISESSLSESGSSVTSSPQNQSKGKGKSDRISTQVQDDHIASTSFGANTEEGDIYEMLEKVRGRQFTCTINRSSNQLGFRWVDAHQ